MYRWTKQLVSELAAAAARDHNASNTQRKLTLRLQGPYADPPSDVGQPDGVIIVTGAVGEHLTGCTVLRR